MFWTTHISTMIGRGSTRGTQCRGSGGCGVGRTVIQLISCHVHYYAIPSKLEAEVSYVVITGIILIYFRSASLLFGLGLIFSSMLSYFALGFDFTSEPISMSIRVSTIVRDFLIVN